MSLDVYLRATTTVAGSQPHEVELYSRNITHNLSRMWAKAGVFDALYESDGKFAKDIVPTLKVGAAHMAENKSEYIPLNPENGWGDYEGALDFLTDYLAACQDYPEATIRVWR